MRILGFSKKWDKLNNDILFTTFRYARRDRDWEVDELVQIVYKPRTKECEILGTARIIRKQEKDMKKPFYIFLGLGVDTSPDVITPMEAGDDGFNKMGHGDRKAMIDFIKDWKRGDLINKLTLYWIQKVKNEQN